MSEEKTRPEEGEEKRTEPREFSFPDCCGPMIENVKKQFSSQGRAGKQTSACAEMMAQMMKYCCPSSGDEQESVPHED